MGVFLHKMYEITKSLLKRTALNNKRILKKWFNRKEFFTLMIIPHTSVKSVKSVKFSRWLVSSFAILNMIMFTVVCVFGFSYYSLNAKLETKKAEFESLQTVKEHDEKQLNQYKANENEIKEKIQVLKNLESKLKDIIETKGGKPQSSIDELPKIASRGMGGAAPAPSESTSTYKEPQNFQEISDTVDNMVKQVDGEINELNEAILKAEKQIKIMRAKPSVYPTQGTISSPYGYRRNPFGWGYEFHNGIDIANDWGTPIYASGDGVVTTAGRDGGYGILVKIDHDNGYESLYGHNSKVVVNVGQTVKRGDLIAYMGDTGRATGPHCHFEVRLYGKVINPNNVK